VQIGGADLLRPFGYDRAAIEEPPCP
jgi:hypothetical protein